MCFILFCSGKIKKSIFLVFLTICQYIYIFKNVFLLSKLSIFSFFFIHFIQWGSLSLLLKVFLHSFNFIKLYSDISSSTNSFFQVCLCTWLLLSTRHKKIQIHKQHLKFYFQNNIKNPTSLESMKKCSCKGLYNVLRN